MFSRARPFVAAAALTALLEGSLYPSVGGLSVVTVGALLAMPLIAWEWLQALPTLHPVPVLAVPLFVALATTGWLHPPVTDYGQQKVSHLITLTLLSALAATVIRDERGITVLAGVWVASATFLAASTLAGAQNLSGRAVGFDDANPIWLGRAIDSGLVALVWLLRHRRVRLRYGLPVLGVLVAAAFATGSRGPLVAAMVGVLVILVADLRHRITTAVALVGVAAAGLAVVLLSPIAATSRVAGLVTDPSATLADSARPALWSSTLKLIEQRPGGVGYGNWADATGARIVAYPHDLWLEVTAEAGWLVGAALIAVTVAVVAALWLRAPGRPHLALALGLLVTETIAVSVSGDLNARTFFCLLCLGYAALRMRPAVPATSGRSRSVPLRRPSSESLTAAPSDLTRR